RRRGRRLSDDHRGGSRGVTRPWPAGAATGVGSFPGADSVDAHRTVFGELPEFPHLVELPGRGPGASLIGRSAALLVDMPVEIAPSSWRITSRAGRDLHRARDLLAVDLDALEQAADGWAGPLKVQAAGPWTLAAGVELPNGHRVLTDAGAVRDLTASLAEGLREHLAEVRRRVPGASVVLQLDEPSLPAVLAGALPTASGYGTVRSVDANVAEQGLRNVLGVIDAGARAVHCCATDVPITLLRAAGADAIAIDAALVSTDALDDLGTAIDAGVSLWLGVVPGTDASIDHNTGRDAVRRIWHTLGFADAEAAASIVPTPACGLANATPDYARRAMKVVREVGEALRESGG
ncbi:MAG TPA: methionine synthase, partial [Jatrophihabitantaceae bacterium]|nr:methionine synthase [Jatrophihabitantaceae bacterium]